MISNFMMEQNLYVATEFGIVVYDADTFLVSELIYKNWFSFDRGTPVFDMHIEMKNHLPGTQQGR